MTEKEKMLGGLPYLPFDEELMEERHRARRLLDKINSSLVNTKERQEATKELLGSLGNRCEVSSPFYCDYGYNISIGNNFYSNFNCTILDCGKVTIGDNVFLAPNVSIFTVNHPLNTEERATGIEYTLPVTIGNNVWIGGNSVINPGVSIGNNVVIGSGSVVTKDIPDGVLAFGNPCQVYKKIED